MSPRCGASSGLTRYGHTTPTCDLPAGHPGDHQCHLPYRLRPASERGPNHSDRYTWFNRQHVTKESP